VTKTARSRIYLSGTVAVPTSMKALNRHVERVFNPERSIGMMAPAISALLRPFLFSNESPALSRAIFANIPNVMKREHLRSE
jgi:hypothetical protein